MSSVTKSIDVNVPVSTAYNQWTQFELFPQFMDGVKEVHQIDDKRLHWRAEVGGKEQEWDARITQQIPDQRIAWTSVAGDMNGGAVDFHRISDDQTRMTLTIDYDPRASSKVSATRWASWIGAWMATSSASSSSSSRVAARLVAGAARSKIAPTRRRNVAHNVHFARASHLSGGWVALSRH